LVEARHFLPVFITIQALFQYPLTFHISGAYHLSCGGAIEMKTKVLKVSIATLCFLRIYAIFLFLPIASIGQDLIPIAPTGIGENAVLGDSFSINEYHFDMYYFPFEIFDHYGYQYFVFQKGNFILSSPRCPFIGKPGTFMDINGDGTKDIVFVCGSGGSAGTENAYIFTLDSTGALIGSFEDYNKGPFGLIDYDDDSYPEPVMGDVHYLCWHYGCSGSPRPYLVWKWDGEKYRLANFKLGDKILMSHSLLLDYKTAGKMDSLYLDTLNLSAVADFGIRVSSYNPTDEYSYPVELLRIMLELIYTGHAHWADSLFNKAWPDSVPNKRLFYDDLMQHQRSDPYWKELQESDW
jgi:hypothetical protein